MHPMEPSFTASGPRKDQRCPLFAGLKCAIHRTEGVYSLRIVCMCEISGFPSSRALLRGDLPFIALVGDLRSEPVRGPTGRLRTQETGTIKLALTHRRRSQPALTYHGFPIVSFRGSNGVQAELCIEGVFSSLRHPSIASSFNADFTRSHTYSSFFKSCSHILMTFQPFSFR